MPRASLASIIREARERAGLTRAQLAKRVGIAPNHVLRLEDAEGPRPVDPRFETIALIAAELGLSLDELATASGYRGTVKIKPNDAAAVAERLGQLRVFLSRLEQTESDVRAAIAKLEWQAGTSREQTRGSRRRNR